MINIINKCIPYIYWLLIAIPVAMLLVSIVSYLSVYLTFDAVPLTEDYTQDFIGSSGKTFWIVPPTLGLFLFSLYIWALGGAIILTPLLLFIKYFNSDLRIHRKLAITLICVHLMIIMLARTGTWAGWYVEYILD